MNTTFPDNEIGKLITVKLEEYEKANDSDALKKQSLILKIFNVAKAVFVVACLGLVVGCIATAITGSWMPLIATLGIFVAANVIFSVFHRAMNIAEINSYDLLKRIKDTWGSPSVDHELRSLIDDAEYYQDGFTRMNELGPNETFKKWKADFDLGFAANFYNDSYNIAHFLGIPFEQLHQNLLSLSSGIVQEVIV